MKRSANIVHLRHETVARLQYEGVLTDRLTTAQDSDAPPLLASQLQALDLLRKTSTAACKACQNKTYLH